VSQAYYLAHLGSTEIDLGGIFITGVAVLDNQDGGVFTQCVGMPAAFFHIIKLQGL
jgi:hypothetical protein